jgi:hypothetical protein
MAGKGRKRRGNIWMFLLLIIPAALVVLSTTILLLVGMIPTMVAFVIDRDPDKPAPITVGGFNFCGCLPFAIMLWQHGGGMAPLMKTLSDPLSWLAMFGSAAVGWAFYFGIPPLVAGAEVMRAERRVEDLKQKKVALVQEWGPDVAGDVFGGTGGVDIGAALSDDPEDAAPPAA